MESSKLAFKLFLADPSALPADAVIPMFHSWIQSHSLVDHLLIDVADYAHVPSGPGTVLVASEANIYLDHGQGQVGLLYTRKQPLQGTFAERLQIVFRATLEVAALIEDHPAFEGKVRFRTDEFLFRINDRLFAPNTPETYAQVRSELEDLTKEIFPESTATLKHEASDERLFEVTIKTASHADVSSLLERLASIPQVLAGK